MNERSDRNDERYDVAVIGAGFAGVACAETLVRAGRDVRLFDKGRGPGGRASTRRTDVGRFDHGAPFFAASEPAFLETLAAWTDRGLAASWNGRFIALDATGAPEQPTLPPVHVGTPSMNAILKALSADLDVDFGVRVDRAEKAGAGWRLIAEDGRDLGTARQVVVAVPSVQAAPLLRHLGSEAMATQAESAAVAPCWTVMAAYEGIAPATFDVASVTDGPLGLVIRQDAKPGREADDRALTRFVLQASADWSGTHLEDDKDAVLAPLLDAFMGVGGPVEEPVFAAAHRWRYAQVSAPVGTSHLWDPSIGVGACGDWLPAQAPHHGIEAAWLSGTTLAEAILDA